MIHHSFIQWNFSESQIRIWYTRGAPGSLSARAYENWNKLVLNEMKWYLRQVRDDSLVVYI